MNPNINPTILIKSLRKLSSLCNPLKKCNSYLMLRLSGCNISILCHCDLGNEATLCDPSRDSYFPDQSNE
jgi:hypothetical protein